MQVRLANNGSSICKLTIKYVSAFFALPGIVLYSVLLFKQHYGKNGTTMAAAFLRLRNRVLLGGVGLNFLFTICWLQTWKFVMLIILHITYFCFILRIIYVFLGHVFTDHCRQTFCVYISDEMCLLGVLERIAVNLLYL